MGIKTWWVLNWDFGGQELWFSAYRVVTPYLVWEEGIGEVISLGRNYLTATLPSPQPATQGLVKVPQVPIQKGFLPFRWNRPLWLSNMAETQGRRQFLLFPGKAAQKSSFECLCLDRIMLCGHNDSQDLPHILWLPKHYHLSFSFDPYKQTLIK